VLAAVGQLEDGKERHADSAEREEDGAGGRGPAGGRRDRWPGRPRRWCVPRRQPAPVDAARVEGLGLQLVPPGEGGFAGDRLLPGCGRATHLLRALALALSLLQCLEVGGF